MKVPKLYRTDTLIGDHYQQDRFELHRKIDWEDISLSDSQLVPDASHKITYIPVQSIGHMANHDMSVRFPLIDLLVEPCAPYVGDMQGNSRATKYRHTLKYALDEELQQLFDYLNYQKDLDHKAQVDRLHCEVNRLRDDQRDNLQKLTDAVDYVAELNAELALLKRPWWRKLWDVLTKRQEP